jgi:hypothetical protein
MAQLYSSSVNVKDGLPVSNLWCNFLPGGNVIGLVYTESNVSSRMYVSVEDFEEFAHWIIETSAQLKEKRQDVQLDYWYTKGEHLGLCGLSRDKALGEMQVFDSDMVRRYHHETPKEEQKYACLVFEQGWNDGHSEQESLT